MRRAPAVALLALGCALAAAAAGSGPYLSTLRERPDLRVLFEAGARARARDGRPFQARMRWWDVAFEVVVLTLVGIGALYALWRFVHLLARLVRLRLRTTRGGVETPPYDPGEQAEDDAETALRRRVADELTALSADLEELPDPREAVIACYVRMERAFAQAGAGRAPTESPMELLTRVLTELVVPEEDVRRLTTLFSEARFSAHPVTGEMRDAARRSLRNVAAALSVPA